MKSKIWAYVAFTLCCVQVILVLASWVVTAAMPEDFSRSLLSPEGIRWFFGRFAQNLASPLLVWLLLGGIAWGALKGSGLLRPDMSQYRQRVALRLVVGEVVVFVGVAILLTMVPHAILLNVMGGLFPSSFSKSLVPYLCFAFVVTGVSFGMASERLKDIPAVFRTLTDGVSVVAPLLVIYVLAVQLWYSVAYVW